MGRADVNFDILVCLINYSANIMFQRDIARIIGEYSAEVFLLPWVHIRDDCNIGYLYSNPNAFRAGMINFDNPKAEHLQYIAQNPAAAEHIKARYHLYENIHARWANPMLTDFLIERHGPPLKFDEWIMFVHNNSDFARDLIMMDMIHREANHIYDIKLYCRYSNPALIDWIRKQKDHNASIFANPAAIDIIQSKAVINYFWLTANPHPWAIEQMRIYIQTNNYRDEFLANPGIFGERTVANYIQILAQPKIYSK